MFGFHGPRVLEWAENHLAQLFRAYFKAPERFRGKFATFKAFFKKLDFGHLTSRPSGGFWNQKRLYMLRQSASAVQGCPCPCLQSKSKSAIREAEAEARLAVG